MTQQSKRDSIQSGYEVSDVTPGPVVASALVLCIVVGLTAFGVAKLFKGFERKAAEADGIGHVRRTDEPVPGPRLQAYPALEMAEHRELEANRTETYGWVDREAGVVRIPVERALELLVERGLPSRPPQGGDAAGFGGPLGPARGGGQ